MPFRILFIVLTTMTPALAVEIIGHRGASHDAPENTVASVKLAWEQKADAAEIDIQLTSDGKIVVIHDKNTKRTAGGDDKPIAKQTLAELRALDAGRWKGSEFAGEKIPALEEVLQTIPEGKRLFIEIKTEKEILPELKRVLKESRKAPAQTPLISFSYDVMRAAKAELPDVKAYWIVDLKPDRETGRLNHTAAELIRRVKEAKLDGLDLGNSPPLTADFVDEIKAGGLELYVWTVNDPEKAREYLKLGVAGITTDRPEFLRDALERE